MLGQPVSMLIPRVVGFKLTGELPAGTTATDLVLTITEMLRKHGVVGKFVEFYGEGVAATCRWPTAPPSATCGRSSAPPARSSRSTTRPSTTCSSPAAPTEQVALVEAYAKEQGLWLDPARRAGLLRVARARPVHGRPVDRRPEAPAGPHRRCATPSRAVAPRRAQLRPDADGRSTRRARSPSRPPTPRPSARTTATAAQRRPAAQPAGHRPPTAPSFEIDHGAVDDRRHHLLHQHLQPVRHGRRRAGRQEGGREGPDPQAVGQDHPRPGLARSSPTTSRRPACTPYLDKLGFNLVGYGCTTCIGNSGPLPEEISKAVNDNDLAVTAVLSGNRNFEGRINPDVKMNYLASPPLVVAYALAGHHGRRPRPTTRSASTRTASRSTSHDIWPSPDEVDDVVGVRHRRGHVHRTTTPTSSRATRSWQVAADPDRQHLRVGPDVHLRPQAPVLRGHAADPEPVTDIAGARVLAKLGDSVTTDHISPAGAIKAGHPGRRSTSRARRRASRTSTPTAPAAATTRS